jgi:hypothetical protein
MPHHKLAIVKQRYILELGLLLDAASFLLFAVERTGAGPGRGSICAYLALAFPWGRDLFGPFGIFENKILEFLAVLVSGWIHPVFLITVFLSSGGKF